MNIGENIKRIRMEKKLKQSEVAEKAHISRVAIGNYERGDRQPNIEILDKIANALDVTIYVLTQKYSFSYELLIYLIKVIDNENQFKIIEDYTGIPSSLLSEIVNNKFKELNLDSQIKILELLFNTDPRKFNSFYSKIHFSKLNADDKIQDFMNKKLKTIMKTEIMKNEMKITSIRDLEQEIERSNYERFEDFKTFLYAFSEDDKNLLTINEKQIIYEMVINILCSINSCIIFPQEHDISYKASNSVKILKNLSEKVNDLVGFELYKLKKNNYTLDKNNEEHKEV